jgi:ubiquinone/menaquinone biosynthesis C-methylase UbiE
MLAPLYLLLGLLGVLALAMLAWRLGSRRRSLPCQVWLRWMVELENPFAKTLRSECIVRYLEVRPGMTVLDIGCGPGRVTIPVARAVGPQGQVVAIDLQPGMLRRAQEKAQAANLSNIRFVQAGLGDGKLDAGPADRALLVTVLGEIPNQEGALKEIFAALKPGGLLSVTETVFDPHYQRRDTVTQLAGAAGFREKAFFGNWAAYTLHLQKP